MLKLYGFAVSNYYNMVKLALLEKGVPFEEVNVLGQTQEPEFKRISPRGKVPCLGTAEGSISETSVILEYIEETQPGVCLLPEDAFARAQVRALMREIELYIELPARACYPEVFFGGKVDPAIKQKAREELFAGIDALKRHARFAPYVAGEQLSLADLYFLYSVDLAVVVAGKLFETDLLADWPQARALFERLNGNAHVQAIEAAKKQEMAAFLAKMRGAKS